MNIILTPFLFIAFCLGNVQLYKLVARQSLTTKQKAFILSIFSSSILFLSSLYLNYRFALNNFNVQSYLYSATEFDRQLEKITLLYFSSYLLCDMYVGSTEYPSYMLSLTGYIHHIVYIVLNIIYVRKGYITVYLLFLIEELPTFILAVGSYNPNFRNDELFGLTFFVTRILYHIFLTFQAIQAMQYTFRTSIPLMILSLHIYWFQKWVEKRGH
jgi:hypothetical protein